MCDLMLHVRVYILQYNVLDGEINVCRNANLMPY